MPLAAIDAAAAPKKIYAVHVDHLNRPIMLTDAAKASVWSAIYEPFGRVHSVTGAVTQNLGLPGQWFQLEHGLAYNWHRHYDPTTGRYTTADPLGFVDGPSVFAYAGSAPHAKVDPTGQFLWAPALAIAAVAILTPSNTFSPGDDLEPYVNAAIFGGGFGLQACVRGAFATRGVSALERGAFASDFVFKTSHYAPRLLKDGVNVQRAETAVMNAIKSGGELRGSVFVDGQKLLYRGFRLPGGVTNIGTIHKPW